MSGKPSDIPTGTRAPGYDRAPAHRVAFVPRRVPVTVRAEDIEVANTTDVLVVEESGCPDRFYLDRGSVDMSRLEKTGKVTYCPFKGLATYYTIKGSTGDIRDAVWSYERPYAEGELLRDRLSFDSTKVTEVVDNVP